MKLSICVITMNRAKQLKEALESCIRCELPKETEFIIIDNASTDDTEDVVKGLLCDYEYSYYYERLKENLGVGGGRNYSFKKAKGEYIYALDDDAVISEDTDFFIKALEILDSDNKIVTLTTQIYDLVWKKNRVENKGPELYENVFLCQMFCGGSHFLRKNFFQTPPYFPNVYGYEELLPSLIAWDEGKINAFCPNLLVIHKPLINKWNWDDEKNHDLLINCIATPNAIKKMMYPKIFRFLLWLALEVRMFKDLKIVKNKREKVKKNIKSICDQYYIDEKIKTKTVIRLIRYFKLSAF